MPAKCLRINAIPTDADSVVLTLFAIAGRVCDRFFFVLTAIVQCAAQVRSGCVGHYVDHRSLERMARAFGRQ
jgi:hypothetical protein